MGRSTAEKLTHVPRSPRERGRRRSAFALGDSGELKSHPVRSHPGRWVEAKGNRATAATVRAIASFAAPRPDSPNDGSSGRGSEAGPSEPPEAAVETAAPRPDSPNDGSSADGGRGNTSEAGPSEPLEIAAPTRSRDTISGWGRRSGAQQSIAADERESWAQLGEGGEEVCVEVTSVVRRRLGLTSELEREIEALHELQLSSIGLDELGGGGGGPLAISATNEREKNTLAAAARERASGMATSLSVVVGHKQVAFEMLPLLGAAEEEHIAEEEYWPPSHAQLLASTPKLVPWVRLAHKVQSARIAEMEETHANNYSMALQAMAKTKSWRSQLLNLPLGTKAQLLLAAIVFALLLWDVGYLFAAAGAPGAVSGRACIFMGVVQLFWIGYAAYFLADGVWQENSFQVTAAAFMVLVCMLYNIDKALTARSIRDPKWTFRRPPCRRRRPPTPIVPNRASARVAPRRPAQLVARANAALLHTLTLPRSSSPWQLVPSRRVEF